MNISKYVGIPYDLHNKNGFCNCWSLVSMVYFNELSKTIPEFKANSIREIAATFTAAFATGEHGFKKVDSYQDFTVVVFKNKTNNYSEFHCGIMYKNKVLHASRIAKGVVYQTLDQASLGFRQVEFWQR